MARLENFNMFAKDPSAAAAFVSVKVQGNDGPSVDAAVKGDLVNMRTFHMEYDSCSKKGRFPACFSRVFGLEVAPFVIVHDPNNNEIEVAVERAKDDLHQH